MDRLFSVGVLPPEMTSRRLETSQSPQLNAQRESNTRMRKDYQFLIGQRFSSGGEVFVVQDLTRREEHTYVQAESSVANDIVLSEPQQAEAQTGRLFEVNDVIQSLLVDEEIELFNPNYLAAR